MAVDGVGRISRDRLRCGCVTRIGSDRLLLHLIPSFHGVGVDV